MSPARLAVQRLLRPRLIVCISGAYADGSDHCLPVLQARQVIRITRTNAIVVHLPLDLESIPRTCLPIEELRDAFPKSAVPLLNTSRATNALQARSMIEYGLEVFGGPFGTRFSDDPLIKLEILDQDLAVVDKEVLRCLEALPEPLRQRTLPILSPDPVSVSAAIALGCPAVRLMTGRIGRRTGILDPAAVAESVAAGHGAPVTFEGGIDLPSHVLESARLGASGVLLNSVFVLTADPVARARDLRAAADEAWDQPAPPR